MVLIIEINKELYMSSRDAQNAYHREWNKRNPEKLREYRQRYWTKRAAIEANQKSSKPQQNERMRIQKLGFNVVLCVTSGCGYERGCIYACVGWNNGCHVIRQSDTGDVVDMVFCNGGVGTGSINNFDDSGAPSFVEV